MVVMMDIIKMLEIDEGKKNKLYHCTAGKPTIGIGHNLEAIPLSELAIRQICLDDVARIVSELNSCVNASIYRSLDKARRMAIQNMAFNMGVPALMRFRKMWHALSEQDWERAAFEAMDSRWYTQVGLRGDRIVGVISTGSLGGYEVVNG